MTEPDECGVEKKIDDNYPSNWSKKGEGVL